MASRSDTLRRKVDGRTAPVRWRVWNGVKAVGRMGVVYPLGMASVWIGQGGVMKFALEVRYVEDRRMGRGVLLSGAEVWIS